MAHRGNYNPFMHQHTFLFLEISCIKRQITIVWRHKANAFWVLWKFSPHRMKYCSYVFFMACPHNLAITFCIRNKWILFLHCSAWSSWNSFTIRTGPKSIAPVNFQSYLLHHQTSSHVIQMQFSINTLN